MRRIEKGVVVQSLSEGTPVEDVHFFEFLNRLIYTLIIIIISFEIYFGSCPLESYQMPFLIHGIPHLTIAIPPMHPSLQTCQLTVPG
jgi:hypothetical protein